MNHNRLALVLALAALLVGLLRPFERPTLAQVPASYTPPIDVYPPGYIDGTGKLLGNATFPLGTLWAEDAINFLSCRGNPLTSPCVVRVYRTTDAGLANFERLQLGGDIAGLGSNTFGLVSSSAGTGAARPFYVGTLNGGQFGMVTNGTTWWTLSTTGTLTGIATTQINTPTLNTTGTYQLNGVPLCNSTAPSISSGFGTTPSVPNNNGNCSFTVNVGTGGTATSGVVTMGMTATNGFNCSVVDRTTSNPNTRESATTTTTVTVTTTAAWTASDILSFVCQAF